MFPKRRKTTHVPSALRNEYRGTPSPVPEGAQASGSQRPAALDQSSHSHTLSPELGNDNFGAAQEAQRMRPLAESLLNTPHNRGEPASGADDNNIGDSNSALPDSIPDADLNWDDSDSGSNIDTPPGTPSSTASTIELPEDELARPADRPGAVRHDHHHDDHHHDNEHSHKRKFDDYDEEDNEGIKEEYIPDSPGDSDSDSTSTDAEEDSDNESDKENHPPDSQGNEQQQQQDDDTDTDDDDDDVSELDFADDLVEAPPNSPVYFPPDFLEPPIVPPPFPGVGAFGHLPALPVFQGILPMPMPVPPRQPAVHLPMVAQPQAPRIAPFNNFNFQPAAAGGGLAAAAEGPHFPPIGAGMQPMPIPVLPRLAVLSMPFPPHIPVMPMPPRAPIMQQMMVQAPGIPPVHMPMPMHMHMHNMNPNNFPAVAAGQQQQHSNINGNGRVPPIIMAPAPAPGGFWQGGPTMHYQLHPDGRASMRQLPNLAGAGVNQGQGQGQEGQQRLRLCLEDMARLSSEILTYMWEF